MQSNLIDSLNSDGSGLYDLTKSYVQQELNQVDGGQVQSALPDGLPSVTPDPPKTAPPAPAPCPTCVRLSRELADLRGKLVALELRLAFSWFSSSQTKAKLRTDIAQAKTKIAATEAALKTARAAAQQAWLAEGPSWGRTSLRPTRSRRAMLPDDMPMLFGEGKRPAAGGAFRLGKAQLIELAQQPDGSNPLGALMDDTWNLWAQGRVTGATDRLAAFNSLGFHGSIGADYRFMPWMTAGLALGADTNETKQWTRGGRAGAIGFSAVPYLGIRLSPNVVASAYAGAATVRYDANPVARVSAAYSGTRLFTGGSLTGRWRDGPWRFQPELSILYGSEALSAYVDSSGTSVPAIVVQAGRVSVGPEIGYRWSNPEDGWQIEPFLRARLNVDYINNGQVFLNGALVGTRGPASGSIATGLSYVEGGRITTRIEGSYDSIGVQGLDVWSAMLRLGLRF